MIFVRKTKLLFLSAIVLISIVVILIILLFTSGPDTQISQEPLPTPFPVPSDHTHNKSDSFPSPNPTYIELLKTEPFWDMLPHYTDIYVIEHIMHNNTIRITTIDPGGENREVLMQSYRNQALGWLESYGADFDTLQIEYVP